MLQADSTFAAAAPGRVNLIGEHVDYCGGYVLPFALDRYVLAAACPNGTRTARIASTLEPNPVTLNLEAPQAPGQPKWANYIRGVIAGFQQRGIEVPGFDAFFVSSLPIGCGLSSSAALECAAGTLIEHLIGDTLPRRDLARLCQQAERDFAGVPCGIMDQYTSVFAEQDKLVQIDCLHETAELIPFLRDDVTMLVANTRVLHSLSDGSYAERRRDTEEALAILGAPTWRELTPEDIEAAKEKLGNVLYRRARHVVTESLRTLEVSDAMRRGDFAAIAEPLAAGHASLRDDFEVTCRELDLMIEIANELGPEKGVLGARMTGGGFGGSVVVVCLTDHAIEICERLHQRYLAQTGIVPQIFASRPARGAHVFAY